MRTSLLIRRDKLISIWDKIKTDPIRIWIASDFGKSYKYTNVHLRVLVRMGLIEKVPNKYKYKIGNRYRAMNNVKGYKMVKEVA